MRIVLMSSVILISDDNPKIKKSLELAFPEHHKTLGLTPTEYRTKENGR